MTNNKQQTAVEWLEQEMLKPNLSMKEILEQAKEMEKEQIKNAHERGQSDEKDYWDIGDKVGVRFMVKSEQYYNQAYGGCEQ
jgi:hypothetical protein